MTKKKVRTLAEICADVRDALEEITGESCSEVQITAGMCNRASGDEYQLTIE